jgi:hypothetical protein
LWIAGLIGLAGSLGAPAWTMVLLLVCTTAAVATLLTLAERAR